MSFSWPLQNIRWKIHFCTLRRCQGKPFSCHHWIRFTIFFFCCELFIPVFNIHTFYTLHALQYTQKHLLHHRIDWLTKIELCANKKPFWCGNVVKSFPLTKRNLIDWVMGSAITWNIFSKIWIIRFYFLCFTWHCTIMVQWWFLDVALLYNSGCYRMLYTYSV